MKKVSKRIGVGLLALAMMVITIGTTVFAMDANGVLNTTTISHLSIDPPSGTGH